LIKDLDINLSIAKKIIPEWKEIGLKPKYIRFLAEYVSNGFNASNAYLKHIARKGIKEESIWVLASNLLRNVKVKEAFALWKAITLDEVKGKLENKIVDQLMHRAFYDSSTFIGDNGKIIPMSIIPEEWRCCVDSVETKYYGKDAIKVITYKLADRDKARQELEKYIEMLKDDNGVTVNNFMIKDESELNEKIDELLELRNKDEVKR
jgi:hypothetical protein